MKYLGINFKFMLLLLPKIIPGIRLKVTIANVRNSLSDLTQSAAASPAKRTKTFSLLKSNVYFKKRCKNRSGILLNKMLTLFVLGVYLKMMLFLVNQFLFLFPLQFLFQYCLHENISWLILLWSSCH